MVAASAKPDDDDVVVGLFPVFKFDDQSWSRIVDALGNVHLSLQMRMQLERLAGVLRQEDWRPSYLAFRAKHGPGMGVLAKAAEAMLDELNDGSFDELACSAFSLTDDDDATEVLRRWTVFKKDLRRFGEYCRRFATKPRSPRPNVDVDRDSTWMQLAEFYERLTGKSPSSFTVDLNGEVRCKGFVLFVQAFMCGIPGEEKPTGNQVREVMRKARRR